MDKLSDFVKNMPRLPDDKALESSLDILRYIFKDDSIVFDIAYEFKKSRSEDVAFLLNPIHRFECCWDKLLMLLDESFSVFKNNASWLDVWNVIMSSGEKRLKRLRDIYLTVTPQAKPFVHHVTKMNTSRLAKVITNYVKKLEFENEVSDKNVLDMTAQEVLSHVAFLQELVHQKYGGRAYSDLRIMAALHELEALYGGLLYYFDKKQKDPVAFVHNHLAPEGFAYCKRCWRLLPLSYVNRQSSYCDMHNPCVDSHSSHDGRKEKKLTEEHFKDNPIFPKSVTNCLTLLNAIWKVDLKGIAEEEWLLALDTGDIAKINKLPKVSYDLKQIFEKLPKTFALIQEHNKGEPSVIDILNILNPPCEDETLEEKQSREVMLSFFAKNLWFYRHEFAMIEVWLTTEHNLFAHRKHGGARKNSGGKRAGAGRPRKSQK